MNQAKAAEQVDNEDLKDWFRKYVALEIEEAKSAEIVAEHAPEWQRGVLAWFADHYVHDDPASLILPDGPGDGGFDIVSIVTSDARNHVRVYQVSAPDLENLADGRISTKKTKFADDIRELRNNLIGKARKLKELNSTALDVLRQINGMRELAGLGEAGTPFTIEIVPLTLRLAHPDARRDIEELVAAARDEWTTETEEWIVREIADARDLYLQWRRRRPSDDSPVELKLRVVGEVAKDHPDRGPFLCFLRAGDLLKAYEEWGAGLLDSNLRYALGKSEVNKTIETELERASGVKWFHEKNNGVVIVCDKCGSSREGIRLVSPQVVNGGQTLHSIANVVREIETIPLEARSPEDLKRLEAIREQLLLPARIVTVSGGNVAKPDLIAIASNTQNKLSERTMRSSAVEMRNLRHALAGARWPWYLVTKDGEWSAVIKRKSLFQSKTGNKQVSDFKEGNRYRRLENTDAAIAMMAFWGFFDEARTSRVFKTATFQTVFGSRPTLEGWAQLATRRVELRGEDFARLFEPRTAPASTWLLAYFVWLYWKTLTFPESQQILLALEEAGERDPEFKKAHKKTSGWDMSDEAREKVLSLVDSCYWKEQIAKSAYLVLVYQSMRILTKRFGPLDEATCYQILQLPQFQELAAGRPVASLGDFRAGSLSDGPLTAIGRILMHACQLFWERHEQRLRLMPSRQQTLLLREWVDRLSAQVDLVVERVHQPGFRATLDGAQDSELKINGVSDLF